jgi:hypothetical protein
MDRSPVPWEPSRRAGERRNGNLIHFKPSAYVTSSTGITKCLRPHCKYRYGESLRRFLPAEATQPPNVPRTNMEIKKRLKGTAVPPAAFMSDLPTGAVRGAMDEGRSRPGADRGALSGIGCNSLLRSPINSPGRARNSMLAALARSGCKSTARFRPLLHPGAKGLLLFRSSSIARGPRRAREPPRFIDSCRPLTDCQPIPNGEI